MDDLTELANTRMPFGKYKDRLLVDLPDTYLVWFERQGFPKGKLGMQLRSMPRDQDERAREAFGSASRPWEGGKGGESPMKLPLTHIWQPARAPSKHLMVVLHGRGDSAEGFVWLQQALAIDSLSYLLLNAPGRYYDGFTWYELPPHSLPGIIHSRQLLGPVFQEAERSGYPPEQTFLFGFSQGCLMTIEFGARHTHRLAGYIGISGYSYDPEALLDEMNPVTNMGDWLITHGTEDGVLPVERTRAQIRLLNDRGFKIDYREYPKKHTIDSGRELPEIREWIQSRLG